MRTPKCSTFRTSEIPANTGGTTGVMALSGYIFSWASITPQTSHPDKRHHALALLQIRHRRRSLEHLVLKFGPYFFAAIMGARPEIDHRLDRRDAAAALGPCVAGLLATLECFPLVLALCGCGGGTLHIFQRWFVAQLLGPLFHRRPVSGVVLLFGFRLTPGHFRLPASRSISCSI